MAMAKNNWWAVGIGSGIIALYLWSKYNPAAVKAAAAATLKANSLTAGANFQTSTPALGTTLQSPDSTPYMLTNSGYSQFQEVALTPDQDTVDPSTGLNPQTGTMPVEPLVIPTGLLQSTGEGGGF